jgi:tetratricopeptide (TPR) repeat protein
MSNNDRVDAESSLGLKKVAFVAMPFGIKPTGLLPDKGPAEVDFDALWDKAILPALSELKYLPIRADNQTGSVIIKDMLEQLVHADLVLADISIPNGNVYYEAGIRHAARETGCILIGADWAKPLFDLDQITQLRYPGPAAEPTDECYQKIRAVLVTGIPALCESKGPVFELTKIGAGQKRDARRLKEIFSEIFEFQNKLATARLRAADNEKAELRTLLRDDLLAQLPGYALRDLVPVVRDHLHWSELVNLIDALPEKVRHDDPYFNEQKAHALSKLGRFHEAVALIETIINTHGQTPERLGTLGGRYRELARNEANREKKRRYLGRAIDAYRQGMQLDLNQYYCAHKLLVALIERGRSTDKQEAKKCANAVRAAAERAVSLHSDDEWIESTLAALAFFERDVAEAQRRIDTILDHGWSNWKLVSLSLDLESLLSGVEDDEKTSLEEILEELQASLPVKQETLVEKVLPRINEMSCKYEKFQPVHARPAKTGEVIVSMTADGEETTNTAGADDLVVRNLTEAAEEYLVGRDKFDARYTLVAPVDDRWNEYVPTGAVLGIEVTRDLTDMLGVGEEFLIIAPWRTEQLVREGDMLVSPLPALDEVYRIARKEFEETYKPAEAE